MCEGRSLEVGTAFRGAVVRQERIDQPVMWLASLNASYRGEYLDRAAATARVEQNIEQAMELFLRDWGAVSDGEGEAPD
jgi:hypothetical protein